MKETISALLQPVLLEKRELPEQLALELLVSELQNELAIAAEESAQRFLGKGGAPDPAVKGIAHRLENMVLRHDNLTGWDGYLDHEMKRKSGRTRELVTDVRKWLQPNDGSPVAKAISTARKRTVPYYDGEEFFPLRDEWPGYEELLRVPALREFLAALLERLTQ